MNSVLNEGNLICITGRPAIGKTALVLNEVMKEVENKKVYFYSFGESENEIKIKIVAHIKKTKIQNVKDRNAIDYNKLFNGKSLNNLTIKHINNSNIENLINEINAICKKEKAIICIDSFNINEIRDIGDVIYTNLLINLKNVCKQYRNKIIITSNISREIETRKSKIPKDSDYGILNKYCDVIINIYNEAYYNNKIFSTRNKVYLYVKNTISNYNYYIKSVFNKNGYEFIY